MPSGRLGRVVRGEMGGFEMCVGVCATVCATMWQFHCESGEHTSNVNVCARRSHCHSLRLLTLCVWYKNQHSQCWPRIQSVGRAFTMWAPHGRTTNHSASTRRLTYLPLSLLFSSLALLFRVNSSRNTLKSSPLVSIVPMPLLCLAALARS